MKSKFKILFLLVITALISSPLINAATDFNYSFNVEDKYLIVTDGQTVTVPDSVTYNDDHEISLQKFHETLTDISGRLNSMTFTQDKKISMEKIFSTTFTGLEYANLFSENVQKSDTIENSVLIDIFERYYMLNNRIEAYNNANHEISETADENRLSYLRFLIEHYNEDINRMRAIDLEKYNNKKKFNCGIPFVTLDAAHAQTENQAENTISDDVKVNYYLYGIIYRDLRLIDLQYSVNDSEQLARIENFNKDNYTYNITLPANTPKDAKIKTNSTLYMNYVLENDGVEDYDSDLSVEESEITLVDGSGTAKVKVVFDISKYKNNDQYSSNIEREYTINFETASYQKGDMNTDGKVNSSDAALVLDRYKNNDATDLDMARGDMDGQGQLNAEDASKILDVFKFTEGQN